MRTAAQIPSPDRRCGSEAPAGRVRKPRHGADPVAPVSETPRGGLYSGHEIPLGGRSLFQAVCRFGRKVQPQGVSIPRMRFARTAPLHLLIATITASAGDADPGGSRTGHGASAGSEAVLSGFGEGGIQLPYEADFVGSKRCADCHTTEAGLQPRSNMFLTGQLVTVDNVDTWFSAAALELPVRWPEWEASEAPRPPHYRRDGDEVRLEGPTRDGGLARAPVHAVFGSGRHAITPVSLEPGRRSRELRVTWSYVFDSWIMTPGSTQHPDPVGYVRPPEETRICFDCHTTRVVWDEEVDPARSVFGVHCERCHGPGSAHVDAVTSGSDSLYILNPGRFPAAAQTQFCSQCHRRAGDIEPLTAMKREARLARHAGAGTMLSDCFRLSPPGETLSCLDCHDPPPQRRPGTGRLQQFLPALPRRPGERPLQRARRPLLRLRLLPHADPGERLRRHGLHRPLDPGAGLAAPPFLA